MIISVTLQPADLEVRVCEALCRLYAERPSIVGTTERAVVGRLAVYLDHAFSDQNGEPEEDPLIWDVEYMRAGVDPKTFVPQPDPEVRGPIPPLTARRLAPDLIWHRRGDRFRSGNMAVLEVKLAASPQEQLTDFAKLRLLTGRVQTIVRFERDLRTDDQEPRPGDQARWGEIRLPNNIHPYRLGLSLNLHPDRIEVRRFERAGGESEHLWRP
jgi:hypothetical protein